MHRTPEVMRNVFETANSIRTYEREALSKFPVIEYKDKLCILAQTVCEIFSLRVAESVV